MTEIQTAWWLVGKVQGLQVVTRWKHNTNDRALFARFARSNLNFQEPGNGDTCIHVTCHPSQTWDMSSCFPVLRGAQQLQLCCCQYVSIIYSLKLYCFRLVPLIYDVKMWALNMQDWLYFSWAYWASWVWAGHEDTDTWHEDTNLCRTCDILTRSLVAVVGLF